MNKGHTNLAAGLPCGDRQKIIAFAIASNPSPSIASSECLHHNSLVLFLPVLLPLCLMMTLPTRSVFCANRCSGWISRESRFGNIVAARH
jgi:hypothetical protein